MTATPTPAPDDGHQTQRIDKWLWFARIVKSRTLAQKLALSGHVRINKKKVTGASQKVKSGDILTVALSHRVRVLQVEAIGDRRGPAPEAQRLYVDLSPQSETAAAGQRSSAANGPRPIEWLFSGLPPGESILKR